MFDYRFPIKSCYGYLSTAINSTTLKAVAQKLATSHLFVGTSELDRFIHKQLLFLTAAGLKPVSQVTAGHWQEISGGHVTVPDDVNKVKSLLKECRLAYHISPNRHALDVLVARDSVNLKKMLTCVNENEVGKLFGYPETAASAFKQGCLSLEKQEAILQQYYQDHRLINLFCFKMSKQHYHREMQTVERWFRLLAEFDLLG